MGDILHGHCDARFSAVKAALTRGFEAGREVGAALAIIVDGELMVDLWGGYADRKRERPWQRDTLCCVFSITKAVTATCVLQAIDDGLIGLHEPVVRYWPEFGNRGKEPITVFDLLTHRAGLVGFRDPVSNDLYESWVDTAQALAVSTPWWPPGERHGYHARTFGFLLGELLRRASGKTPSQWIAQRFSRPLDLDFHVGLSEEDLTRCADMIPARVTANDTAPTSEAARRLMADYNNPTTVTGAAFNNPSLRPGYMNRRSFRMGEFPSQNGHGTARSVAMFFGKLPELVSGELLRAATQVHSDGPDEVLQSHTRFGLGFMLNHERAKVGISAESFGHAGAGGSLAFYDPPSKTALCFLMNQMEQGVVSGGTTVGEVIEVLLLHGHPGTEV